MSHRSTLEKQQLVLSLLAEGSTAAAAAHAAGVHRNTVSNWRREDAIFQQRWKEAHFDQSMHWRDQMQALGDIAANALRMILEDPQTSPSVRLKAALAVLHALTTPAQQMHNPAQKENADTSRNAPKTATPHAAPAQPCTKKPKPTAEEELNEMLSCCSGVTEAYAGLHNGALSPESVVLRHSNAL